MNKHVNSRKASVAIPSQQEERTRFGHIGIIAAVCFTLGVSWPFLAGVKLVPNAPNDEPSSAISEPSKPVSSSAASAAAPVVELPRSKDAAVEFEKSVVISCLDSKGRKLNRCDKPDLDKALLPHFKALAACKADAEGKLSLGLKLDFEKNKVVDVVRGKSTNLDKDTAAQLMACAKSELSKVSLAGIDHLNSSYVVFYFLSLVPAGTPLQPSGVSATAVTPASGSATVVFESAMVRDSADSTGKVLTRLLFGTRVFVTGRLGEWYEVIFDSKGRKGFVHKNALGME